MNGNPAINQTANNQAANSGGHAPTSQPAAWNQANARTIWQAALANLESMTETFARVVERVEAVGTNTLRLVFPHDGALARRRCELPEHKTALSEAIAQAAGQPIQLEFDIAKAPEPERTVQPVAAKPSRLQRMREIESHPLVKSCVELFDAEIVRIDKPK